LAIYIQRRERQALKKESAMKFAQRQGLLFFLFSRLALYGIAQSEIILTNTDSNLLVNGAQAITQAIDHPYAVIADDAGGFYFSDSNRIYRVASDGSLSLTAGSGTGGFSGDGGQATAAKLNIWGMAVDSAGNLFIADTFNYRIRKVTTKGIISTVAGGGTGGLREGGLAIATRLGGPQGLAVDSDGNLFIAEYGNHRILKVTAEGLIGTVAGNGVYRGPIGGSWHLDPSYTVGGDVKAPVPLLQPLPSYTAEARKAGIEGIVILRCMVRINGTTDSFRILNGLGYGLDESAIDTVFN
jgi:hypothetical protein